MEFVWTAGRAVMASEVIEALAEPRKWSPRTIRTLLGRLVRKGALGSQEEGNRYLYHARVSQEECLAVETRTFLDRAFGGAAAAMLNYFVRNSKLSREEIAELRRALARKEK